MSLVRECTSTSWNTHPEEFPLPEAGIQTSLLGCVLWPLVKHMPQNEMGSTSQAARVKHEAAGPTSLCKCTEQIRFG